MSAIHFLSLRFKVHIIKKVIYCVNSITPFKVYVFNNCKCCKISLSIRYTEIKFNLDCSSLSHI